MIKRRQFAVGLGGLAASGVAPNFLKAAQKFRKNAMMHVGGDYHSVAGGDIASKQNLEYSLRHGVKHLTAEAKKRLHAGWDPDELKRMKDNCDKFGVVFEAIRELMKPPTAAQKREIGFHTNFSNRAIKPRSRTRTKVSP